MAPLIVVDAGVLVSSLTDDGPVGVKSRAELTDDPHWAAPEHVLVETFSALRGQYLGRKVGEQRALDALTALAEAAIELLSTKPLLARMWQLRGNVTGYDAAYVAAAEMYRCPLLTNDVRLAAASGLRCEIRLGVPRR